MVLTEIVLEGYAFSQSSAHSVKLHELTGIIKYELQTRYPHAPQTIYPPTVWRKYVHGNGHATKEDAIQYVDTRILPGLQLSINPLTDICDAACLVHAHLLAKNIYI